MRGGTAKDNTFGRRWQEVSFDNLLVTFNGALVVKSMVESYGEWRGEARPRMTHLVGDGEG